MAKSAYQNVRSFASKIRKRRSKYLINLIEKIITHNNLKEIKIADIGGDRIYWKIFPFERFPEVQFKIELINILPKKLHFTEDYNPPNVEFIPVICDCTNLTMADKSYHLCHSNSVIEHVGSWENVKKTVAEAQRVAQYVYHQTPNFWFPYEPHYRMVFVHWLPRPMLTTYITKFSNLRHKEYDAAKAQQDEICTLTRRDMKRLFPDHDLINERYLLVKSFMAISKVV
jgi:hypothetical protein